MSTIHKLGLLIGALVLVHSSAAGAFQIETIATTGCHERITRAASASAGWPDGLTAPAPTDYDQRIIDDVPFDLPFGARDPWTLALVLGIRNNDIGGKRPTDLPALSTIHNDPELQPEHCLRLASHDGQAGDEAALATCREFILSELALALGSADSLDLDATVEVQTYLKFRGKIDLDLNRFAFHTGRALHALQDGFTHILREPDTGRVRSVLNWIEGNIGNSYDEARDGHPHLDAVDDCAAGNAVVAEREMWATDASTELLAALADGTGGRAGRLERADAVLDRHLEALAGCTVANNYCDAPELSVASGCRAAGSELGGGVLAGALILFALAFARRRRSAVVAGLAIIVVASLFSARTVHAQPAEPAPVAAEAPPAPDPSLPLDGPAESDDQEEQELDRQDAVIASLGDPTTQRWGVAFSAAGAFDRGGAAASAGVRFNPFDSVGFGLDLEYNPWISISELDTAPGVVNVYLPVIVRLKKIGSFEVRTTFAAGISVLTFDLVGANRGTVGAYVGWNPLGIALSLGANFKLIVKPGDIAVPIPQLRGIPFYYHQYRFTVGVEWFPG